MSAAVVYGDPERIQSLTDKIMAMIVEDCHDGVMPWSVRTWWDLDDRVDANMYFEDAGQVFDGGNDACIAEVVAVQDALEQRMQDGELVADLIAAGKTTSQLYGSARRKAELVAVLMSVAPRWEVTFSGLRMAAAGR